jgi:hypothetical protein
LSSRPQSRDLQQKHGHPERSRGISHSWKGIDSFVRRFLHSLKLGRNDTWFVFPAAVEGSPTKARSSRAQPRDLLTLRNLPLNRRFLHSLKLGRNDTWFVIRAQSRDLKKNKVIPSAVEGSPKAGSVVAMNVIFQITE